MRSNLRLIGACCTALCVPLLIPLLTGRVFVWDDLGAFHLPVRHLYREALRAGDSILWSPAFFSGVYLFGEGQAGMAHPFHWFLYRLLPLSVAFNIELIAAYVSALAGMWTLLRRWTSTEASLFGAMVFAFSGFNLLHLGQMNAVGVAAHLPWLLLATHALVTSANRRTRAVAFAGIVLLIASQLLLGYPQYVWLNLFADVWFVAWLLRNGAQVSRLAPMTTAVALGVCVGGVQLLPTFDALRQSVRATSTLEFRLIYSLPPFELVQIVSPYAMATVGHDFGIYDGAFCTVAIAWLFVRWPDLKRRDVVVGLLMFAAVALLLALGRHGAIYPLLARVPGPASFRAPARFILLVHLACAGIAALVFDDLAGAARGGHVPARRFWPLTIPVLLSATVTGIAATLAGSEWATAHSLDFSSAGRASFGSTLLLGMTLLFVMAARGARWVIPAIAVLATFDMGVWGYRYAWRITPPATIDAVTSSASVPEAAVPGDSLLPIAGQAKVNLPVLRGFRLAGGYLGLNPRSTLEHDDPLSQRLAGVAWRAEDRGWVRVPDAMPRARMVSEVRVSERIAEDVRHVDISSVALVMRSVAGLSGSPGHARVIGDRPGRIVVRASAPERQLLVLTERFHDGWRATSGDHDYPTLPVYGDYLACVVERGTHDITFAFEPASVRRGLWLTIGGLLTTVVSTWVLWRS